MPTSGNPSEAATRDGDDERRTALGRTVFGGAARKALRDFGFCRRRFTSTTLRDAEDFELRQSIADGHGGGMRSRFDSVVPSGQQSCGPKSLARATAEPQHAASWICQRTPPQPWQATEAEPHPRRPPPAPGGRGARRGRFPKRRDRPRRAASRSEACRRRTPRPDPAPPRRPRGASPRRARRCRRPASPTGPRRLPLARERGPRFGRGRRRKGGGAFPSDSEPRGSVRARASGGDPAWRRRFAPARSRRRLPPREPAAGPTDRERRRERSAGPRRGEGRRKPPPPNPAAEPPRGFAEARLPRRRRRRR